MRILQLAHQYLPDHVGGVELYTHNLSLALSRRGHSLAICHRRSAPGDGLERQEAAEGNLYALWDGPFTANGRFRATFGSRTLRRLFNQVLDETEPELVHVQHLMGLPAAILDDLAARQIPYLITLWDFWWVCANAQLITNYSGEICAGPRAYLNCARCALARANLPQFYPALPALALPLAARNRRLRQALTGARKLIAPAEFVRSWHAEHGIPAQQMTVIPPGLDYSGALPPGNSGRPLRIGYIGGLSWQKGVHVLLEAFSGLDDPAELSIAGDPNFDPDYSQRLQQLADHRVRFLDRLDRPAVWQMLSRLDVVVVTSLWYETFCFVISEAFAAGVPVISADLGVLSERVRHEVDGLLVPPGDVAALRQALQRLQQEGDLLPRLGQGIDHVTTVTEHVDAIETVYEKLLAGDK